MKKLIFIILMMFALTAKSQSAISYGESSIFQIHGHSDYTVQVGDTIIRSYCGGKEIIYFIDQKVVRQISLLTRREAKQELKILKDWNAEREGWRWTGITMCRIERENDLYIMECKKYNRHEPIPEIITEMDEYLPRN